MDNERLQLLVRFLSLDRWPVLLMVYLILRMIFGISYVLIYGFVLLLIFLRISVEKMLIMFFGLVLIFYVLGQHVEANHYMSFVFGFMIVTLALHLWHTAKNAHDTTKHDKSKPVGST